LQIMNSVNELHNLRNKIKVKLPGAKGTDVTLLNDVDMHASALENTQGNQQQSFSELNNSFASLLNILQGSDRPPATQVINAVKESGSQLIQLLSKWDKIKKQVENIGIIR
jgi:hypothetical protein